jgi:hypothetical protein
LSQRKVNFIDGCTNLPRTLMCLEIQMHASYAAPALPRIPLVPQSLLKAHGVDCIIDTRFRAAARLLQRLWLKDNNIATGIHVRSDTDGQILLPLESLLSREAAHAGRNFLSPAIHTFVRHELIMREEGACYDEERLFGNALSSMPLTFNIFAPLAMDLKLASSVFQQLIPEFVHHVTAIRFETSPGRRNGFLLDGTAWDLAIEVITPDGEPATIFTEVKYSESMEGPAARWRERYDESSRQVGLFVDPDAVALRSLALEQLWREHMLAVSKPPSAATQTNLLPRVTWQMTGFVSKPSRSKPSLTLFIKPVPPNSPRSFTPATVTSSECFTWRWPNTLRPIHQTWSRNKCPIALHRSRLGLRSPRHRP